MSTATRLLGLFIFSIGVLFAYALYRSFDHLRIETISMVLIPVIHLGAGFGFFGFKSWARYWAFSLCGFYVMLGALSHLKFLSLADFIPLVPVIDLLPARFLKFDDTLVSVLCFFVLPIAIILFLSLKKEAARFDPWLQGRFSWGAPALVLASGAFVFSYALFETSNLSYFTREEARTFFGYSLSPVHGKFLHYAEFYLPLVVSVGLVSGSRIIWFLAGALCFYYWSPHLAQHFPRSYLNDTKFLFYGAGWLVVTATLLLYWRFFWEHSFWHEERLKIKSAREGDLELKEVDSKAKGKWVVNQRVKWSAVLFSVFVLIAAVLSQVRWPKPSAPVSESGEAQVGARRASPLLKFEGSVADASGLSAVVNGSLVQVGSEILGYRIEEIQTHQVILSKEGKRYLLDDQGNFRPM